MKFFLFAAALLLFSCTSSDQTKTFAEGTIEYSISYEKGVDKTLNDLMAQGLTVKMKKDKLYLKLRGGIAEMKPYVIIDMRNQELLYPNFYDSTVLPKSLASLDYGKIFKEEGKGENIMGYATTRYTAKAGLNEYTIEAADAIPVNLSNTFIMEGFYISVFNKMPLRIKVKDPSLSYTYNVQSIKAERIPDSVFAIPKGFKTRRP